MKIQLRTEHTEAGRVLVAYLDDGQELRLAFRDYANGAQMKRIIEVWGFERGAKWP